MPLRILIRCNPMKAAVGFLGYLEVNLIILELDKASAKSIATDGLSACSNKSFE